MSPTLALILALLAAQTGLTADPKIDENELKQIWKREEVLHQEMSRLLQEIEGSRGTMETLLCPALKQHWLFWGSALALVLVLLPMGCCLLRRRRRGCVSCREQEGAKEKKQGLPSTKVLKEVVDELLRVCRVLSWRSSMPELHLASGTDTSSEAWSIQRNSSTFRPLVILQPPPGYSFHAHSTGRPPAGRIRVALECLCSGEQLLGQTCFLHASGGQLPRDQSLLDTLCTGSCLDARKVIRWVQMLVSSAWLLLPQSCHYQLSALPCSKSCSWQLSSTSGLHCRIEMDLAVQECSSGAYLSLE
ncbi:inositol 1,4,5-trisphosphate receptor-interacting protein-like 1 [Oenanthe melanoleuca]|uniref:inositol 1,4,5-trisphosphate receptor-interacting protein-like 1 n=1 Tax=Oenanthe melanoleuca TaxID=2939378 RepID=UPI0024C13F03|nr:inositol 1,4,5-trisphosphate receptor-interacting protein-like 1 [Oenanthe melanoleuca]